MEEWKGEVEGKFSRAISLVKDMRTNSPLVLTKHPSVELIELRDLSVMFMRSENNPVNQVAAYRALEMMVDGMFERYLESGEEKREVEEAFEKCNLYLQAMALILDKGLGAFDREIENLHERLRSESVGEEERRKWNIWSLLALYRAIPQNRLKEVIQSDDDEISKRTTVLPPPPPKKPSSSSISVDKLLVGRRRPFPTFSPNPTMSLNKHKREVATDTHKEMLRSMLVDSLPSEYGKQEAGLILSSPLYPLFADFPINKNRDEMKEPTLTKYEIRLKEWREKRQNPISTSREDSIENQDHILLVENKLVENRSFQSYYVPSIRAMVSFSLGLICIMIFTIFIFSTSPPSSSSPRTSPRLNFHKFINDSLPSWVASPLILIMEEIMKLVKRKRIKRKSNPKSPRANDDNSFDKTDLGIEISDIPISSSQPKPTTTSSRSKKRSRSPSTYSKPPITPKPTSSSTSNQKKVSPLPSPNIRKLGGTLDSPHQPLHRSDESVGGSSSGSLSQMGDVDSTSTPLHLSIPLISVNFSISLIIPDTIFPSLVSISSNVIYDGDQLRGVDLSPAAMPNPNEEEDDSVGSEGGGERSEKWEGTLIIPQYMGLVLFGVVLWGEEGEILWDEGLPREVILLQGFNRMEVDQFIKLNFDEDEEDQKFTSTLEVVKEKSGDVDYFNFPTKTQIEMVDDADRAESKRSSSPSFNFSFDSEDSSKNPLSSNLLSKNSKLHKANRIRSTSSSSTTSSDEGDQSDDYHKITLPFMLRMGVGQSSPLFQQLGGDPLLEPNNPPLLVNFGEKEESSLFPDPPMSLNESTLKELEEDEEE